MTERITRRGVLAATVLAGVTGLSLSSAGDLLETFAPLSGRAWDAADRERPERVESPYGEATVRMDDHGVPHVAADDERAAYFAVGHCHGFDRGFQLDLQRRQMRGQLSAIVGDVTLESDEFHRRMDFSAAAEATLEGIEGTPVEALLEAYAAGVNAAFEGSQLPLEFSLLEYEPEPWTPVDTLLMEKQIAWSLTGDFTALRESVVEDRLDPAIFEELYPERMDHEVPVLRTDSPHVDSLGELQGIRVDGTEDDETTDATARAGGDGVDANGGTTRAGGKALVDWLARFETGLGVGSNSWVVSGKYTDDGRPIVANDPHLELLTPPLWYEQHVETPETNVRGVTFPGVPFVVIGTNDAGAWGFTNVGADVLDCYTYEIDDDAERYRYRGEWRDFDHEEVEIEVAGDENRTITVRKTVHGPLIEREDEHIGVAWTGLCATRTTEAVYELTVSEGAEDVIDAADRFDVPTQNLVYGDVDGRTVYLAVGRLPIRRDGDDADGDPIPGNRVFDGSAGEGDWAGYTPYGGAEWDGEGFVPAEEQPGAIDPDVLATANQRLADDPVHYVGVAFAMPYRGRRIYDVLDEVVATDTTTDLEFHTALQVDSRDERAPAIVSDLLDAGREAVEQGTFDPDGVGVDSDGVGMDSDETGVDSDDVAETLDALESWDYRMTRDSRGALVFARWFEHLRERTLEPVFSETDLDETYYPNDWIVATLPADSPIFADRSRDDVLVAALVATIDELDETGWEQYGDWNTTEPIGHPLGGEAPFLDHSTRPTDGSRATVGNYRFESAVGASWRMVAQPGVEAVAILPGGNSGDYFSSHYDDQFERWADGEYKPLSLDASGSVAVRFEGVDE